MEALVVRALRPADNATAAWNATEDLLAVVNGSGFGSSYDGDNSAFDKNGTTMGQGGESSESWTYCNEWTAQHKMFQTANFFFIAAFLVPTTFKQSVLIVRALLTVGFVIITFWAGTEIYALDIMLWNLLLVLINLVHTVILVVKFLPPTLTLELTELYLKVFKPFKVSKKHFKELVREAKVLNLERGDIYAVEDVSPADERLSILLRGKLRVTCDDTHLHFIHPHHFIDSPEWEANHEQSDDVFQVTITAEDDCTYLCWPRRRLERVLRHRPLVKVVLDSLIGKDITHKLYSLNEHLHAAGGEYARSKREEAWARAHSRSLSLDAVDTGTTGRVRSIAYKNAQKSANINAIAFGSPAGQTQCWIPLVANHFPAVSPFTQCITAANQYLPVENEYSPINNAQKQQQQPVKKNREVTFVNEVEEMSYET